jgi:hypothetical protein
LVKGRERYRDARKLLETLTPRQSMAASVKRLSMSEIAVRVALHWALKSLGAARRRSVE